jgi:hypothetical protein
MGDGSAGPLGDGCSNLAKFSQGRNKNFSKISLRQQELTLEVSFGREINQ